MSFAVIGVVCKQLVERKLRLTRAAQVIERLGACEQQRRITRPLIEALAGQGFGFRILL